LLIPALVRYRAAPDQADDAAVDQLVQSGLA
jgi:hypothetical protein